MYHVYAGSNGHASFSTLKPGGYTLRVVALNRVPDKDLVRRSFEITGDPQRCIIHLINSGVTVSKDNATVEFAGVGPARGYRCRLDRNDFYGCKLIIIIYRGIIRISVVE